MESIEDPQRLEAIKHSIPFIHTMDTVNVNGREFVGVSLNMIASDFSYLVRVIESLSLKSTGYHQALEDILKVNGLMGLGDAIIIADQALKVIK